MKKAIQLLLLLCLLTGCSTPKANISNALKQQAKQSDAWHRKQPIATVDTSKIQHQAVDVKTYRKALTYVKEQQAQSSPSKTLTRKEALSDTKDLFFLLEQLYGSYDAFGGKQRFEEAQKAIEEDIKQHTPFSYEVYAASVRQHLHFLNDAHVQIDGYPLRVIPSTYATSANISVTKTKGKFMYEGDTIQAIDNDTQVSYYMKPTIHNTYRIVLRSATPKASVTLTLDTHKQVVLPLTEVPIPQETEGVQVEDKGAYVYVQASRMFYDNEKEKQTAFIEGAKKLREKGVGILDLRGNSGGDLLLVEQWLQAYSEQKHVRGNITSVLKLPYQDKSIMKCLGSSQSWESFLKYHPYQPLNALYAIAPAAKENTLQSSEAYLIVLQDQKTASAAEHLIDRLHRMEHVVFIGTSTFGMVQGSSFVKVYLKHSSLPVQFGNMENHMDESYAKEYAGIAPDIWLPSDKSLAYAQDLIKQK